MQSGSHAALSCRFARVIQGNPGSPCGTRTESAQNAGHFRESHNRLRRSASAACSHSSHLIIGASLDFVPYVQATEGTDLALCCKASLAGAGKATPSPRVSHLPKVRPTSCMENIRVKLVEQATTSLQAKTRNGHRQYIGRGPLTGACTL